MSPKTKATQDLSSEDGKPQSLVKTPDDKDEATPASVSIFRLYTFTTASERALMFLGLFLAAVAGAMQPLMTIIFGTLTTAFTNYGAAQMALYTGEASPEALALADQAEDNVRREARNSALWLLGIGIGMMIATYGYTLIFAYVSEINSKRLREAYLRAVLRQEIAYFDNIGAGEVATRIQTDCHLVQDATSDKVAYVFQYLSQFITGFIIGIAYSWRLGLILSSGVIVITVICIPWATLADKWNVEMLEHYGKAGSLAEEIFGSVRTVKAFASEKVLGERFDQLVKKARGRGRLVSGSDGIGFPLIMWVVYSMYACGFFYGGLLVSWNISSSGNTITVIFAIMIAAFGLGMISDPMQAINKGISAGSKLFETIDRVPSIDSSSDEGIRPQEVLGTVALDNVKFHYPSRPDVPILKGFDMQFEAGQSVALVGASGSGKSTIISLVERFYDPISGVVRVDGHDVRNLNLRWLRQQIGLVSQEPTLFQTTVRGNIEHGLIGSKWEHASDDDRFELVRNACIAANAHDFITALPEGYDTYVGDRGMLLSGGQKQRVAIARAIVSDPRILLLDEATSALDTQSEGVVQDALDRASKGRTTITIAHRLSTIKNADKIVVMGAGEILQVGTHDELLADSQGSYAQLVAAQKLTESNSDRSSAESDTETAAGTPAAELQDATITDEKPGLGRAKTNLSVSAQIAEDIQKTTEAEEAELAKRVSIFRVARRMWSINKKDSFIYLIGIIGGIAHGAVYPAVAILFGKTIEDFQIQDPQELRDALRGRAQWYFVTAFAAAIVACLQTGLTGHTGQNLSAKLRSISMVATLKHDVQWFDEKKNSVGALTSNLSNHPQKVMGLFGATLGTIAYAASTIVVGSVIGLGYAPLLALIGIACLPLIISQGIIRLKVVVNKDEKTKKIHESSAHLASEATAAVRTVASLTREGDVDRMYQEALEEPLRISVRTALWSQALFAVSQGLLYPIMSLVFWVGSQWLLSGRYTTSEFFIVLIAVVFASNEASHFFSFVPDASKAKGAAAAIFRLIDYKPRIEIHDAPSGKSSATEVESGEKGATPSSFVPRSVEGRITLEDVHFRYPSRPGVRVLRDLNMTIEPGSFVALVGPSGCGKSTTIQMLERFYDPLSGKVMLDGHNIKDLSLSWFRSQVALVSQEPTLYSGSVRFNVLLGANKPMDQVTEEEVIQACKDANIYDFVMSLPQGLDTEVGGKGSQLSGGQKQRIAIARALIRNPKILLLDEATSALDSQSERVVQAALDQAAKGRTTIAIAHRLATIQKADVIYCFKDGQVGEAGTHDELLAKKGQYFELVQMQNLSKKEE